MHATERHATLQGLSLLGASSLSGGGSATDCLSSAGANCKASKVLCAAARVLPG